MNYFSSCQWGRSDCYLFYDMRVDGKSTRFNERRKLDVPVEVYYQESAEFSWTEDSRSEEVTICGLGLTLSRPVEPNHVINIRLPMPKRLRLFDYSKGLYDVWGLVRSIQVTHSSVGGKISLKVGVALIGQDPPPSFIKEPETLYDLNPVLMRQGFWSYRELPRNWRRYAGAFDSPQDEEPSVILKTISENGRVLESVEADVQKANEGEMVLLAKLSTKCSKYLVIGKRDRSLALLAKVLNSSSVEKSDLTRIHLELISGEWLF